MKVLKSITEVRVWRKSIGSARLGFVPTMGALHEGHLSLAQIAKSHSDHVIASIFVNPLQFGPNEDLAKYPRNFERDNELLGSVGVDAVFFPSVEEMYPKDASTYVIEEKVSQPLCGPFRPGHFRGVTTVVMKLFQIVQPDVAVFGQKDAQQCAVIERMVRDLNVPVELIRGPTLRERDGLAMSSRNAYLSPQDRARATRIYLSLKAAQDALQAGERDVSRLTQIGRSVLESDSAFKIQYWDILHPSSLEPIAEVGEGGALAAVAAYLGTTRLIDNFLITPSS